MLDSSLYCHAGILRILGSTTEKTFREVTTQAGEVLVVALSKSCLAFLSAYPRSIVQYELERVGLDGQGEGERKGKRVAG